ncbi:MAG: tetratricopeptide repeat protein [Gemmatimonadetes bacterium]|nr:tetratricopeptide repeat protein [Gemmatimonadota bacterium]
MAIKGSLKEASLPDVLQLLSMGKKTGCLSVTHRNNFGSIYFDKGRICYASIVNRRDRLGDILLKSGAISPAQLDEAIAAQGKQRDKRLGEILVSLGIISREALHDQIRVQIEEAVYFLFTWSQGTFNFEPDLAPEEQDFLVSINPESLLLEGARRVDEWGLIEKKIPSFDIVFDVDRRRVEESRGSLSKEQEVLLPLIDGRRDVTVLVEESGLVEFEVGKALYGLATAGFLHRVGKTKAAEVMAPDARVEEHRNLGIAFYKTGMLDEAEREFRRVADLRPGDLQARFVLGLVHLRLGRWDGAVADFEAASHSRLAAPAVFHNLAFAFERRGEFAKARDALREAMTRGGDRDPRVHVSLAVLALREGSLEGADTALQAARPLFGENTPSAVWFHFAALTAWLGGRTDEAVELLREGTSAYPHAAVLHNNLAVALERKGQNAEAMAAAERGIAEDPGIATLYKNHGDCLYRAGRFDEAFDAYQRAVKLNERLGPDVWFKLGNIRLKRRERADAIQSWERALALDPGNRIVRQNLEAAKGLS